jgi:DNA invertase Pin-like site-specific DNA recombinase
MKEMKGYKPMILGYCRTSTVGQPLNGQIEALTEAGAEKLFTEQVSGVKSDREALSRLLRQVKRDDVVIVTALDRLGRSLKDVLIVLETISKKGAKFKSLREAWADSTTEMGQFLINIIGSVSQLERSLILARTAEGRKRAMAHGVKFGRKLTLTSYQQQEAVRRYDAGESFSQIAKSYNVTHPTISRIVHMNKNQELRK